MWGKSQWDEFCERAITALLLTMVAVTVLLFGGTMNPELRGFALLALPLWLLRLWLGRSNRVLLHPAIWPALAFLLYAAWRATHAEVTYPARMELFELTVTGLVVLLAMHNLHRQEITPWVVHTLAIVGCLTAGYAIVQLLRQSDHILWLSQPSVYARRAGGTFINPNHLAAFLVTIFPLSAAIVFLGREKPIIKVLHGYAALMMLGGVAVTMSRGGWAAAAVALLLLLGWLFWKRRELRLPLAIIAFVLFLGGTGFVYSIEKARSRLENITATNNIDAGSSRQWLWETAMRMWHDHFWLGVGPGEFATAFPPYRTRFIQLNPGNVHNEYLDLLVDYGTVGGLLFAAALGALVWWAVRTSKYVERGSDLGWKSSNRSAYFVGESVGLLALAFHCLVDFNLHVPAIALTAAILVGLLAANVRHATERFWLSSTIWSRLLVTLASLAALVWLVPTTYRAGAESYYLNRAAGASKITPALMDDLQAAMKFAPDNPRPAYELGENLRRLSAKGQDDWKTQAETAVQWFEHSAQLDPLNARTRIGLARTRYWLADTNRAAADFDLALKLGPNDVTVFNYVAWNYLTRGRTNEAEAMFKQTREWNNWDNWMALHYLEDIEAAKKAGH
ncbi:MAG TPA: O-antigen ligase family protein [Candidatus Limnocylindria bacterium]|nr:O-antigen ligase family protein [Candidatus Limnocylindria bacterium]